MKKRIIKVTAISIVIASILVCIGVTAISAYARSNIDFAEDERLFDAAGRGTLTRFYANASLNQGEYIPVEFGSMTMGNSIKSFYPIDEISVYLRDGFVAVEDKEFYSHDGVNLKRTALALFNHLFKLKDSFGASTITQQVIKNISGDSEVTVRRKLNEIFRALRIEDRHTKNEILELYLNIVPLGENIVGVGAGALHYFGKEPSELLPEEAAVLIGLTNAPSLYNPHNNPKRCTQKRNIVLRSMLDDGVITESEYERAVSSELSVLSREDSEEAVYSWFTETVINDAARDYAKIHGIGEGAARVLLLASGYEIYTTQNIHVQTILEDHFGNPDNFTDEINKGLDFCMTVTDCKTGDLLGIVGSVGEKKGNLLMNHATAPHTPASALKPIALYAPLIDEGRINWATVFDDVPIDFLDGVRPYPANSPNEYSGLITVKDALRTSKNTVAMRLYKLLGSEKIYSNLKNNFGFSLVRNDYNDNGNRITDLAPAPLALGQLSRGISLRELTEAYTVFAQNGVLNKGRSYIKIVDSLGKTVLENNSEQKRVFKKETAEIMNQLLMNVTDSGTARSITLGSIVDTAGKTGTSGGNLEKLFVGYTPYVAAGIRSSYNDNKTPVGSSGASHLAVWDEVMTKIHSLFIDEHSEDIESFSTDALVYEPYCKDSGELYSSSCMLDPRENRLEYGYFTRDNRPTTLCHTHIEVMYDAFTEAVAHEGCPEENLIMISLLDIPNRRFPVEVVVSDAEYVYRRVADGVKLGDSFDMPYFQNSLADGEYVGRGSKKRQFNHNCYIHD